VADQAGRELGEDDRDGRDLEVGLLRVRAVVQADGEDLARLDGVGERDVVQRVLGPGGVRERGPGLRGRDEALRPRGPASVIVSPSRRPMRASPEGSV
jgi:hypothetical protein